MALISCPECGKEVSDQALACIHCGYPLQSFPPPKRAPRQYSLVFTGLGPHADIPAALHCLSKELGLSQKDAQALLERAPAVLVTHLKPREAQRLVQVLAGYGISSKIVVGEEVSSPIYIPPVRTQREPLSFWMTVLAIVLGINAIPLLTFLFIFSDGFFKGGARFFWGENHGPLVFYWGSYFRQKAAASSKSRRRSLSMSWLQSHQRMRSMAAISSGG